MGKWHKGDKLILSTKGRKYGALPKFKNTVFIVEMEWSDRTLDITFDDGKPAYVNIRRDLFKRLTKDMEELMKVLYG